MKTESPPWVTPCVICGVPLDHHLYRSRIPHYLCLKCFRKYSDQLDAPWMKFLQNQERYRRMKRQRRIKSGHMIEEISLDLLAEGGLTLAHAMILEMCEESVFVPDIEEDFSVEEYD